MKHYLTCFLFLFLFAGYAGAQFLPDAQIAAKKGITSCIVKGHFKGGKGRSLEKLFLHQGQWIKAADLASTKKRAGTYDSLGRLVCACWTLSAYCHNDTLGYSYYYGANGKLRLSISHSCEKGDSYKYFFYDTRDSLYEVRYNPLPFIPVTLEKYYRDSTGKLDSVIYYWTSKPEFPESDSSIMLRATIHRYDTNGDGLIDKMQVYDPFCAIDGNENCESANSKPFVYRFRYRRKK